MLRKTHIYVLYVLIFSAAAFMLLFAGTSSAGEKWRAVTWDGGSDFMAGFDALCLESGLTSFDVLEANGYIGSGKRLPSKGDELLVPVSKGELFATWMEVQNRNGGSRPLVTVKLHGVPDFTRVAAQTTQQAVTQPAVSEQPEESSEEVSPSPAKPPELPQAEIEVAQEKPAGPVEPLQPKNMRIVVSGDEIILRMPENEPKDRDISLILDPAVASQDLIIPDPPVLKPMTGRPPVTQGKMIWPVSGKVSSGFGRRGRRSHHGLDIPMPKGTPIAAALDGVVADTATNRDRNYRGYGNTVVIDHGNGIVTMYAHCSKLSVKKGQRVRQGEIVGLVGNTGRTTTHHVHFEIRKNGSPVNPIPYLVPR